MYCHDTPGQKLEYRNGCESFVSGILTKRTYSPDNVTPFKDLKC